MLQYNEELFSDCIDDALPLLLKHWNEVALHKDSRPLDPDYTSYYNAEECGLLRIYTARDNGALVGYAAFFVMNNLHYQTWLCATNDIYFIDRTHRKYALQFFRKCESWLKDLGVKSVYYPDKLHLPKGKLFERLGYKAMEVKYEKVL